MKYTGSITFPNSLNESLWKDLLEHAKLSPTQIAKMTNLATGDTVSVKDPPNLLAVAVDEKKNRLGVFRSSRMFFNGGIGADAEISFEGEGDRFKMTVENVCAFVRGVIRWDEL